MKQILNPKVVALIGASEQRVLRIAHLTDVHLKPDRGAEEGFVACLKHVHELPDRPDVIFNGGDCIGDCFSQDYTQTKQQWEVWDQILRDHCQIPIEHCIGNHDVWGWNRASSKATGNEPLYGKKWAMEQFGLTERYRSFERGGWHFIVLDSTYPHGEGDYKARLDEEQFEWLAADLAATPKETPVLVFSHIPILCGCAFLDGENEKSGDWIVPGQWMHLDARRIKDLFYQHPNVKLCLSGHIHLHDRLDYNGVTYLCNGAVCGNWWRGTYQETPPGYALVDLYHNGSFEYQYVAYNH